MVDRSFSLTLALQSIARDAGCDIDIDDLHAALGLSVLTCAVPAQTDLGRWPMHARDAFLVPGGRIFGFTIRELHPPDASLGLNHTTEFAQHFQASYRPLVERALENDQPVLAWQGWPGDDALMWGVVKGTTNERVGLTGAVPALPDATVPQKTVTLVSPPTQLYVLEGVAPQVPDRDELLTRSICHAYRALCGEPTWRFRLLLGAAAFRFWGDRIKANTGAVPVNPAFIRGHHTLALSIAAAFQSAIRFFERHAGSEGDEFEPVLKPAAELCRRVIGTLHDSMDLSKVRRLMGAPEGRAKLTAQVTAAEVTTMDLVAILERVAGG